MRPRVFQLLNCEAVSAQITLRGSLSPSLLHSEQALSLCAPEHCFFLGRRKFEVRLEYAFLIVGFGEV